MCCESKDWVKMAQNCTVAEMYMIEHSVTVKEESILVI
jgi:hypothetical protein